MAKHLASWIAVMTLLGGTAFAQQTAPAPRTPPPKLRPPKTQTITIDPLSLAGTERSASLLFFLERAHEELARATLERRSFIPHLVRSVDDEAL